MAVPAIDDVAGVIGSIYEAAYDQRTWRTAMANIAGLFHGSRACIVCTDAGNTTAIGSYDDEEIEQYDWNGPDAQLLRAGMQAKRVGDIYSRDEIANVGDLRHSHLWNEMFRIRQMDHNLSCNLVVSGRAFWAVDVSRAVGQGAFDSAEIAVMRRIIPHVKRAGEIGTALQGASLLSQLYNNLPFGLLVIDSSLEIRHGNETAYELLARPDLPLSESRGKLLAPGQKNAGELQRLVAAAFGQTDGVPGPGGTILLPAEATSGEARLLVSIAPLAPSIAYGLPVRRSVVVMLREIMAETIEPLSRSLPGLFKLSRTESLIAAALAQGKRLQDVAEERGIQVKTARGYLEAIFRKTGTHRQSELVALLRSTQPLLRPPPSDNDGA